MTESRYELGVWSEGNYYRARPVFWLWPPVLGLIRVTIPLLEKARYASARKAGA